MERGDVLISGVEYAAVRRRLLGDVGFDRAFFSELTRTTLKLFGGRRWAGGWRLGMLWAPWGVARGCGAEDYDRRRPSWDRRLAY